MIVMKKMSNEQINRKIQNESEIESEIEIENENENESDHQNENNKIAIKQYLNRLSRDIKTDEIKNKDNVNQFHFIKLKD